MKYNMQELVILKSFGIDIHPMKDAPGLLLLVIGLNAILMGQLKVLQVHLVLGVLLEIIMLPMWVVSFNILVIIMAFRQR